MPYRVLVKVRGEWKPRFFKTEKAAQEFGRKRKYKNVDAAGPTYVYRGKRRGPRRSWKK